MPLLGRMNLAALREQQLQHALDNILCEKCSAQLSPNCYHHCDEHFVDCHYGTCPDVT